MDCAAGDVSRRKDASARHRPRTRTPDRPVGGLVVSDRDGRARHLKLPENSDSPRIKTLRVPARCLCAGAFSLGQGAQELRTRVQGREIRNSTESTDRRPRFLTARRLDAVGGSCEWIEWMDRVDGSPRMAARRRGLLLRVSPRICLKELVHATRDANSPGAKVASACTIGVDGPTGRAKPARSGRDS